MRDEVGPLDRRRFLGMLTAGTAALAAGTSRSTSAFQKARPNIVLITADDMGFGDLSGYGRVDYQTPVLDRLAAEGTRFTQAYAIAPLCTPTRVGFMTGRYPARHVRGRALRRNGQRFGRQRGSGADVGSPAACAAPRPSPDQRGAGAGDRQRRLQRHAARPRRPALAAAAQRSAPALVDPS